MNEAQRFWVEALSGGALEGASPVARYALVWAALVLILAVVVLPVAGLLRALQLKFVADLQARVGPRRVGMGGLLQPVAELLRLLRRVSPALQGDAPGQVDLGFWVVCALVFASAIALPLSSRTVFVDSELSVFTPILLLWFAAWIALFSGLENGRLSVGLQALRASYQSLIGLLLVIASLLVLSVFQPDFKITTFASHTPALESPFQFAAALLFFVGGLIFMRLPPFAEGEGQHPGVWLYARPLSSWRAATLRVARLYTVFLWCALTAVVAFGGWRLPGALRSAVLDHAGVAWMLESAWVVLKVAVLLALTRWLETANPRPRVEQLTEWTWRALLPLALLCLIGAVLWGAPT